MAGEPDRAWLKDPASPAEPLYDVGSHRIDACNFLFGRPQRATACSRTPCISWLWRTRPHADRVRGRHSRRHRRALELAHATRPFLVIGSEARSARPAQRPRASPARERWQLDRGAASRQRQRPLPAVENSSPVLDGAPLPAPSASHLDDWVTEQVKKAQ